MPGIKHIFSLLLILLVSVSCSKMDPVDCFRNSGPVTTEMRGSSAFRYIHMKNNVDVLLKYAPEYAIEVKAGKNIIPGIKTEISNETLTIENENSCNWIRSYESPIEVHISAPQIDSIIYQSSGNLTSVNKFVNDSLKLDVIEGGGSIKLWVDLRIGQFNLHYGTVDLTVRGYSHISYLSSAGYGPANLSGLNTEFTFMTNNSINNCRVRSNYTLHVKILNLGDVYYSGNPSVLATEISGEGMLIKE